MGPSSSGSQGKIKSCPNSGQTNYLPILWSYNSMFFVFICNFNHCMESRVSKQHIMFLYCHSSMLSLTSLLFNDLRDPRWFAKNTSGSIWCFQRWLDHKDFDLVSGFILWVIHNMMVLLEDNAKWEVGLTEWSIHWMILLWSLASYLPIFLSFASWSPWYVLLCCYSLHTLMDWQLWNFKIKLPTFVLGILQ